MNFLMMIPVNLSNAMAQPDTWEMIAAILAVALPILGKRFWTEKRQASRAAIERWANVAADVIIVLVESDAIPDDEVQIMALWTERFKKLLTYAGIKFDAKTEALARAVALERIGQAALIHEAKKLGPKARELGKSIDRISYEFTNGLTSRVKK